MGTAAAIPKRILGRAQGTRREALTLARRCRVEAGFVSKPNPALMVQDQGAGCRGTGLRGNYPACSHPAACCRGRVLAVRSEPPALPIGPGGDAGRCLAALQDRGFHSAPLSPAAADAEWIWLLGT